MPEVELSKPPAQYYRSSDQVFLTPPHTHQELMLLLESEYGVYFYPRVRLVQVPEVSSSQLVYSYGIGAEKAVAQLGDYIEGQVVFDQWTNHEARRVWKTEMEKRYGETFREVYSNKNQVRFNRIAGAVGWLNLLEMGVFKIDPDLAGQINKIRKRFPGGISTKEYNKIYDSQTNEEKLNFVRFVIDQVIEAMHVVAPKPSEYDSWLVT